VGSARRTVQRSRVIAQPPSPLRPTRGRSRRKGPRRGSNRQLIARTTVARRLTERRQRMSRRGTVPSRTGTHSTPTVARALIQRPWVRAPLVLSYASLQSGGVVVGVSTAPPLLCAGGSRCQAQRSFLAARLTARTARLNIPLSAPPRHSEQPGAGSGAGARATGAAPHDDPQHVPGPAVSGTARADRAVRGEL
jgi:hypothetical protein